MSSLSQLYLSSRRDAQLVVLEGFHALKHAILFGAEITSYHTCEKVKILAACSKLAPDLEAVFAQKLIEISREEFNSLSPNYIKTGVIAIARKPVYELEQLTNNHGYIVYLDNVRNLKNLGSIVRVCAARGIAGVLYSGTLDVWNSDCVSVARGLQFAIPVLPVATLPVDLGRPIVCFDERGDDFAKVELDPNSILVFGSERSGISNEIKERADLITKFAMQRGVSSLNLATSVAIAVYR